MRPFQHEHDNEDRLRVFKAECLKHLNAVFRFALSLTKDRAKGEDLMQETMTKALISIDQYTEGTNAKAWLLRICYTTFVNDERKRKRQPKIGSDDESALKLADPNSAPATFDGYSDEVTQALNALKEVYRTSFMLAVEGHQYAEIADITGAKLNTVRTRIRRARLELIKMLGDYGASFGFSPDLNSDFDA